MRKTEVSDFARAAAEFSGRRGLFAGAARTLIALSGGPDSCAALLALIEASDAGFLPRPVAAAHFHHGLRGADADADAAFCAALCARLSVPCLIGLGAVPRSGSGSYSNDTARRLRYGFLEEAARETGANVLVTAHTADDQAETVLGRILRGTSGDGLAGIPARRELSPDLTVVRPLLSQTRAQVEAYCALQGVTPRHDPSNDKDIFPRVRLRRRLPELARDFNPRLTEALIRLADHAAQDSALLTEMADALWHRALLASKPSGGWFDAALLREAPPALRRRVLLRALRQATGPMAEGAATGAFVARLENLMYHPDASVCLPGGIYARRVGETLSLAREGQIETPVPSAYALPLPIPGEIFLTAANLRLSAACIAPGDAPPRVPRSLDIALAFDDDIPLLARPLQPGERMAPLGMGGKTRRVRDMMAEAE